MRLDNKSHRARSRGKKLYNVHIVQCKSHGSSSFGFCFRYVVHIQGVAELSLPHSLLELIARGKIEALHGSSKEVALVGAEGDEGSWKIPSLGVDQMRRV